MRKEQDAAVAAIPDEQCEIAVLEPIARDKSRALQLQLAAIESELAAARSENHAFPDQLRAVGAELTPTRDENMVLKV